MMHSDAEHYAYTVAVQYFYPDKLEGGNPLLSSSMCHSYFYTLSKTYRYGLYIEPTQAIHGQ